MILEGGGQNAMPRLRATPGANAGAHPFVGCEQDVLCVQTLQWPRFRSPAKLRNVR
jgi:hypothetical protein